MSAPVLPIEVVPNTNPPRFKWRQVITTPIGPRVVEHEGMLQPAVEDAVALLCGIAAQQSAEIVSLKKQIDGHCARIAAQHELLAKRAEKVDTKPARSSVVPPPAKGK